MLKYLNKRAVLFIGAVMVLLGTRSPASAEFIALQLQEDGGTVQTIQALVGSPVTYNGTFGNFYITFTAGTSNSPGRRNALTQLSNVFIQNTDSSTHTLSVNVSAQGFTNPTGLNLPLTETVGGSVASGSVTGTFQGFADATDTLFGQQVAGQQLTFSASGINQSLAGTLNGNPVNYSPGSPALYSVSIFSSYTLSGGTMFNGDTGSASVGSSSGGNQTINPAPTPTGLVMALTSFPLLGGLSWWSRRRRLNSLSAA